MTERLALFSADYFPRQMRDAVALGVAFGYLVPAWSMDDLPNVVEGIKRNPDEPDEECYEIADAILRSYGFNPEEAGDSLPIFRPASLKDVIEALDRSISRLGELIARTREDER